MSTEQTQTPQPQFSAEEVAEFIAMGKNIAGKSVLSLIIDMLEVNPTKANKKLINALRGKIPARNDSLRCIFDELPDYPMHMCLTLADRDYVADVRIPSDEYVRDIYEKYNFLRGNAIAYWRQFADEDKPLFDRVCTQLPHIDFSNLVIDDKVKTSMYFDAAHPKRVSIYTFFCDRSGKPYIKR